MLKTRLSAFLSLLVVFLSGAVAGGFVYRFYNPPLTFPTPPTPQEIRIHIVADMKKSLDLDDAQVAQLQQIMDDVHAQSDVLKQKWEDDVGKIREQQVNEIKKMLRPEQQTLYDKWLADRQAERERRKKQQKSKGGGGGFRPDR